MNTTNNTVLITGGSAGIGFELAKSLSARGNKVIITGRNVDRLNAAAAKLPGVTAIASDVSKKEEVETLVATLTKDFPTLNMVINNAGRAIVYSLVEEGIDAFEKSSDEFHTNFFSVVRFNEKILPLLKKQKEAAIVNVSSIVVFAPGIYLPTYAASKAALHSYTQALRLSLEQTSPSVKVFELMPPLVNTEFSEEIGGKNGIAPSVVADQFVEGLSTDNFEIHVGDTASFYKLYLSSPNDALLYLNQKRVENFATTA